MAIFEFGDQQGVRTRGTLRAPGATPGDVLTVGTSRGTVTPSPGGGSQPVQAIYGGNAVNIGNGVQDFLTFDTLADGAALLDISTPSAPTFVAAGAYAVTATYFSDALTAGGFAVASVGTSGPHATDATDSSDHPDWSAAVPLTVVVDTAGLTLQVTITNNDGVAARNFALLNLTLVKLA